MRASFEKRPKSTYLRQSVQQLSGRVSPAPISTSTPSTRWR